mmetsp:Transcript_10541/g.33684  ORF Transcript_10541/g.33684 Transcript_10541/m.33684 type:complete len:335 (-) Transcript_10541:218-1222(-)
MLDWVIGVSLSVAAAASASLGDNLIKWSYAKTKARKRKGEHKRPLYRRPVLLVGNFCNMVLNTGLSLVSFAFVDASISIPFGGMHIAFNVPLAYWINGERSSAKTVMYTGLVLVGVLVTLVFGNHSSNTFHARDLARNFLQPAFIASTLALGLVVYVVIKRMICGDSKASNRLGWCLLAGLAGSLTQAMAKVSSECTADAAWDFPFTWVAVITTLALAAGQVVLLNLCLDWFDATYVVPIVNATIIIAGSLYAGVLFQELERWTTVSKALVPFGIFLTGAGIALLALHADDDAEDDDTSSEVQPGEQGALSGHQSQLLSNQPKNGPASYGSTTL